MRVVDKLLQSVDIIQSSNQQRYTVNVFDVLHWPEALQPEYDQTKLSKILLQQLGNALEEVAKAPQIKG